MPTFFCPACFAEIDPVCRTCPVCGADVAAWRNRPYRERLLQALKHPLADVRLTAIEVLGRLRAPDAAEALAACARHYPNDPVQGIAVIRALRRLPPSPGWTAAVRDLEEHPVAAVARAAAQLASYGPMTEPTHDPGSFRALVDDYAGHAVAVETVADMGAAAIPSLRHYLEEGPQVNPQGRLFAVDMLARLDNAEAIAGLRAVLRTTPLSTLSTNQQSAEYQVKNAALCYLAERDYSERDSDVAYAVRVERLPGAIGAAGRLGLVVLATDLAKMLRDDVLEHVAGEALIKLGKAGAAAVIAALPPLFKSATDNTRVRLALVRSLLVLWQLQFPLSTELARMSIGAHPYVAAAAALFAAPDEAEVQWLVRGGVSSLARLAGACRERLQDPGCSPWLATAAEAVLRRNQEPDIYGNTHTLSPSAARWLVGLIPR